MPEKIIALKKWLKKSLNYFEGWISWFPIKPDGIKVRIPKREAVFRLPTKNWVDSRLAALQNTNPYLCLEYESFLTNQDAIAASALKFFQCDPKKMRITDRKVKKQSKGGITDYVLNFTELVETLEPLDLLVSHFDRH
jgi:hypothetical protein